jgi:ABC-2 type transport system ATP-binding protein
MIRLDKLTKNFASTYALRGVDLSVPAGQLWGLLGPNGAGKTTLFRILMGIIKPSFGSATIDGLDAFEDRLRVKRILGFLPDEPVFHSYLTGREIVSLAGALHGLDENTIWQRVEPLADRLQLTDALTRFADDYSRGMKKKLGLILALLHAPKLLVLDEPTNGLDLESTTLFFELMRDESARGVTVVFSTHLLPQVEQLCSHVAVIHLGRLVAHGDLASIASGGIEGRSLQDAFIELTKRPDHAARARRLMPYPIE